MRVTVALSLIAAGVGSNAAALAPRAVIAHDAVVGFAESGSALELKFKPELKVVNGCVPFPAVDAAGNTRYAINT
jgi:MinD-like ATPase involved in chromosome partitioning or flagellar assembly